MVDVKELSLTSKPASMSADNTSRSANTSQDGASPTETTLDTKRTESEKGRLSVSTNQQNDLVLRSQESEEKENLTDDISD